jgi:hypothetical protein
MRPGTLLRPPEFLIRSGVKHEVYYDVICNRPGLPIRFFAGQPDPNDPSHFTLRYELSGQPGIIDGLAG